MPGMDGRLPVLVVRGVDAEQTTDRVGVLGHGVEIAHSNGLAHHDAARQFQQLERGGLRGPYLGFAAWICRTYSVFWNSSATSIRQSRSGVRSPSRPCSIL